VRPRGDLDCTNRDYMALGPKAKEGLGCFLLDPGSVRKGLEEV